MTSSSAKQTAEHNKFMTWILRLAPLFIWQDCLRLAWGSILLAAYVIMRECGLLLSAAQVNGQPAAHIDTLFNFQLFPSAQPIADALTTWAESGYAETAAHLVTAHTITDFVFALLVAIGIGKVLFNAAGSDYREGVKNQYPSWVFKEALKRRGATFEGALQSSKEAVKSKAWRFHLYLIWLGPVIYLFFDWVENILTLGAAAMITRESTSNQPVINASHPLLQAMNIATYGKWLSLFACTAIAIVVYVIRKDPFRGLRRRAEESSGHLVKLSEDLGTRRRDIIVFGLVAIAAVIAVTDPTNVNWIDLIIWPTSLIAIGTAVATMWRNSKDLETVVVKRAAWSSPRALEVAWRLRLQVSCVAFLVVIVALPGDGPLDQLPDVLRAAADGNAWRNVLESIVSGGILVTVVWSTSSLLLHLVDSTADGENDDGRWVKRSDVFWLFRAIVLVLLLVAGFIAYRFAESDKGVFAAAIVVASGAVLNVATRRLANSAALGEVIRRDFNIATRRDDVRFKRAIVYVSAIPIAAFGVSQVRAFTGPYLLQLTGPGWLLFGLGVLVVACVSLPVLFSATNWIEGHNRTGTRVLAFCVGFGTIASLAAAGWAVLDPTGFGADIRANDVIVLWVSVIAAVGGILAWFTERYLPPMWALRIGVRRAPIFVGALLVFVLASQLNEKVGFHAVEYTSSDAPQVNLENQFNSWRSTMEKCRTPAGDIPLVMVAAPGGGIRAAYWTALGMETLTSADTDCLGSSVFLASGVSGGSVGLATWTADPASSIERVGCMSTGRPLASATAALLYRDLPGAVVGYPGHPRDRADIFENVLATHSGPETLPTAPAGASFTSYCDIVGQTAAPAESVLAKDFYADLRPPADQISGPGDWRPLLILNGTDLATGCRVVMTHIEGLTAGSDSDCRMVEGGDESPPKPFYGAYDIRDLSGQACGDEGGGRGITSVTAAHLSARFPLISPTGAVSCAGNDAVPPRFVFDADGGYLENSGLQAIAQAYTEIEPLISKNNATPDIRRVVPYVVLLENSSQAPTVSPSSERLHEVPAVANGKSISQPLTQDLLREELAVALYRQGSPGNAVPQVQVWSPPDFPSVSAPLGWTLSAASRVSLYDRMISLCEKDKGVVAMREFLSGSAEAPNCEESLVNTG